MTILKICAETLLRRSDLANGIRQRHARLCLPECRCKTRFALFPLSSTLHSIHIWLMYKAIALVPICDDLASQCALMRSALAATCPATQSGTPSA